MTSKPKTYQNYSFNELIAFSQQNPYRNCRLTPIEIVERGWKGQQEQEQCGQEEKGQEQEVFGLKGYTIYDLQPTGLISMMVCMNDPHAYALSTPAIRSQQVIEHCTRLQERTDELRTGPLARKRKRVYELLGAIFNESTQLDDADYVDLFRAMEVFQDAHFVLMNRAVQQTMELDAKTQENTIGFSSSPLLWKRDRPVWLVDARGRWLAIPTDTVSPLATDLAKWLPQMAEQGWTIQWPEAEGTKTELVEQLVALGAWQESDKKITKDILAGRLGKEKTLDLFRKWKSLA
jgi:hypothetical protein